MYRFFHNFPKEEEQDIRECLKMAKINEFKIDKVSDKKENGLLSLYLKTDMLINKDNRVELYYRIRRMLKNKLMIEYKKIGYNILPCNVTEIRLNMDRQYLNLLCTTDLKRRTHYV